MKYFKLKVSEFEQLKMFYPEMDLILIEINKDKNIIEREIGVDSLGHVIHKFPGKYEYGTYGLNDQVLSLESLFETEINKEEFYIAWEGREQNSSSSKSSE